MTINAGRSTLETSLY